MTVNFLTYNGLLSAIPEVWKRSIVNSERMLTDVDSKDLPPANVTANSARELLVLKVFKAPNVETKQIEKCLPIKAIYELPVKVTLEKLRCFQYKIIHNILPTNSRLHKLKLKISPSCDRCSSPYETLSHLLYECSTVQTFWQKVIAWWNEKRSENVILIDTDIFLRL